MSIEPLETDCERRNREAIEDYRRRHPEATGSDLTIALLASLEAAFAGKERAS